jgi:HEAT repeat protein
MKLREEDIDQLLYKSSKTSLQTLMEALDDPELRSDALSAIMTHKRAVEAVPKLLSMLEMGDKSTRLDVLEALEKIPDPRTVEPLLELISDKDEEIRLASAWALIRYGDRQMLTPMLERLKNASDETKETVWYTLGDAGWVDEVRQCLTC